MLPHLRNFYSYVKQMKKLIGPIAGRASRRGRKILERSVSKIKNFNIRKAVDSVNTRLVFATSGVLIFAMAIMLFYGLGFRFGYHVYMDGEYVASVKSKSVLEKSMASVDKALGEEYNFESEPSVKFAIIRSSSEDITPEIIEKLADVTEGIILTVDGKEITTFANSEDATDALCKVLESSRAKGAVTAEFADNIEFKRAYVKKSAVKDIDSAIAYLTSYKTEPKTYTLLAGENLDSVSQKLMITKEELLNRNTGFVESDFKPGAEIVINCPRKVLSVRSEFTCTYTEEIPFETKTVQDSSLYVGVTNLKTTGKAGSKEIKKVSSEIDGIRVASTIVEENVINQPVAQVEVIGTKTPAEGVATGALVRPVGGIVTSRYGSRWGRVHHGVDIDGETGDPIKAADGGTVITAGDCGDGYGLKVVIDHGDGSKTLYAHCNELLVSPGVKVNKGDIIAKVGNTGYSTGSHLHFEVIINGQSVDPLTFFNE